MLSYQPSTSSRRRYRLRPAVRLGLFQLHLHSLILSYLMTVCGIRVAKSLAEETSMQVKMGGCRWDTVRDPGFTADVQQGKEPN